MWSPEIRLEVYRLFAEAQYLGTRKRRLSRPQGHPLGHTDADELVEEKLTFRVCDARMRPLTGVQHRLLVAITLEPRLARVERALKFGTGHLRHTERALEKRRLIRITVEGRCRRAAITRRGWALLGRSREK